VPKPSITKRRPPRPDTTRAEADIVLMRQIVGFFATWRSCHASCRRAKRCTSPTVACFDRNSGRFQATFEALADWPRLDGPRDPDELDRPAYDTYD